MSISQSNRGRRADRRSPAASVVEAAGRAKRARDHLARKRRQERQRLERERWRAENASNRAQLRGLLGPLVLALAVAIGIAMAAPVSQFLLLRQARLERVFVQGAVALSPRAIARGAGIESGRTLDKIDPAEIRASVVSEPWIESARVLRLPTGTLVISVVERNAVARWQTSEARGIELVDDRGERFPGATEPGGPLPLVQGESDGGRPLPTSAIEILGEIRRHANLTGDPSSLTLHLPDREANAAGTDSGYVLQIGEEGPRALLGKRLLVQRVARLAALLGSDDTRLRDTRWIDLRYADRAVLRTEPASG